MNLENGLYSSIGEIIKSDLITQRIRVTCSFPVIIKGFNLLGEHYDELALVEDIGYRGLCFRTTQDLTSGLVFTLYNTTDDSDPIKNFISSFKVVWVKQHEHKVRKIGAELIGNNYSWLNYLINDTVILSGISIAIGRGNSH